jgi:integrase
VDNIIDGKIQIKTQKTKKWVAIPLHPMVSAIIDKHKGLPRKYSNTEFNIQIKEVCRIAGIQGEMKGSLMDVATKRKVTGVYSKYKLVSSHICRRSFATNNYKKVPNDVLMAIGGWETEEIFLHYIKKSLDEYADELGEVYDNQNTATK